MYVIFTLSIINISLVYISIYSPRIVVRGDVCFVVLKGSSKSLNMSSCCINLLNANSLAAFAEMESKELGLKT